MTALYTSTTRKGDYFRGEVPFNNSTGAIWLTITNVAVLSNYTGADIVTNIVGSSLLAKTPETFEYDADGNLTNDSLWSYTWDAENRLVKQESVSSLPTTGKRRLEFAYDPQSRRIQKLVSTNSGSAYVAQSTNRFVYDIWNLVAILNPQSAAVQSFMWGLDLSGSLQGAGGVGGVLAVNFKTNGTHYFCYDGQGNVSALVNAANGSESARYEYGPFAEPLRMTGPVAKLNPIRFSTQYADEVTGDLKYLFRDYDPDSGRWPNRDPLGEPGFEVLRRRKPSIRAAGPNLYLFVRNSPISTVDFLGLDAFPVPPGGFPKGPKNPCPCGEAAAQIAAVGPVDANTARRLANEALAAARASGLPGLHNGQADAFRHCFWSCRMAQEIGAGQAKEVGDTHERCNKNPAGEEAMDQANNATGRGFGTPGADCNAACLQAARDGTLQTSPSGTPPANPY